MYTARSSIGQAVYGSLTEGIEQTRNNEANHGRRVFHTHALHTSELRSLCIFSVASVGSATGGGIASVFRLSLLRFRNVKRKAGNTWLSRRRKSKLQKFVVEAKLVKGRSTHKFARLFVAGGLPVVHMIL